MNIRWNRLFSLTLSVVCLAAFLGCSGGSTSLTPVEQPPLAAEGWVGSSTIKDASGAPSGIRLSWARLADPSVTGYHVYKSDNPIPNAERGNASLWLDFDGSPVYAQPSPDVTDITIDDVFPVSIGEVYYYRVTSLATDGSESLLSQEIAVTISNFSIDGLSETSVAGGSEFTILGENFGLYDMAVDEVTVRGVEWVWDVGFVLSDLQCPILNWQPDSIEVTLPLGATSGRVEVTVNGVSQTSLQSVMNSNPFITHCSLLEADPGDSVTLSGLHFGGPVDVNNRVIFGTLELTNPASYSVYSGDMIMFEVPSLPAGQYEVKVAVDGAESNVAYIEILGSVGPAWAHTWGSTDADSATGVTAGESTDLYIAGYSSSFSGDPFDTLIVKYDAGTFAWARSWNNTDNTAFRDESLTDICYNTGYVYATGTCLADVTGVPCVLLLCYDVDGNFQYARRWGSGSTAMAMGNAITCDGTALYITGAYTDADADALMLKYDLSGNFLAAQTWAPSGNMEMGNDITVDVNGDIVILGTTEEAFSGSGTDWFVLKTDENFTKQWAVYWGTMDQETIGTITTDATGNIFASGSSFQWATTDGEPVILELTTGGSVSNEYRWTITGTSTFIGLDFATTGDLYGVISRWPGTPDFMVMSLDPSTYTANIGWEFFNDPNVPVGVRSTVNTLDDILVVGSANAVAGTWADFTQDGTAIVADTISFAETGTDPATATGGSEDLTGTDTTALGVEDVGAGLEDVMVHSIKPE